MKENNDNEQNQEAICWFCKKGRHSECMKQIPVDYKTEAGQHDCSFDTGMIECQCGHKN